MESHLEIIKRLISVLPEKDEKLCIKYLEQRNFKAILEIVKSDIYKAKKKESEESPSDYLTSLISLDYELTTYMSYIEMPDSYNEYDNYY